MNEGIKKQGNLIKGYRKRRGFSRSKVVKSTNLTLSRLSDIENGRRSPIKLKELIDIHNNCFLLPLSAFIELFPAGTEDCYSYAQDHNKKFSKKITKKRKSITKN